LLNRLIDLSSLTVKPARGERSGCFSSFDRRSDYLPVEDRYADWGANDDGSGYIRKLDDGSIVALELNGPGTIVRSWSAMPSDGNIRVYIDGELIINKPFEKYFTGFGSDFAPANTPDICPHISRGYNSFIPIPFQTSIRIELAPGWGMYYHFTYTLFAMDTVMPAYSDHFTRPGRIALARLDRILHERGVHTFTPSIRKTIPAFGSVLLYKSEAETPPPHPSASSGAIELLQIRLNDASISRDIRISMYWDGEDEPSVSAPLCDFFGTSENGRPFASWLSGYIGGVYYSRWLMPYSLGARVELTNASDQAIDVEASVKVAPCRDADERMRFCARFTGDGKSAPQATGYNAAQFEPGAERFPDWPLLITNGGAGRFCGVHLRITNMWTYPNGMKEGEWWFGYDGCDRLDWWWGEGDEKFFVDGEKFPSTFGTGSEDYIGYAWAAEPPFALFDSPFAANSDMPLDGNGITSVCRYHVADNIPFQSRFEAFIEKYKGDIWGEGNRCEYEATAFWYQEPVAANGIKECKPENKTEYICRQKIAAITRPALRFAPARGWTNDPNGLLYDGKQYHLFAQYHPADIVWGPMHWLHAVSDDITHWREVGIALRPDALGTIFSGSAVVDMDNSAGFGSGAIIAMYTSHGDKERQCIAYSVDGINFTAYSANPVIDNPGIRDFRDPKVFRDDISKCWNMALAAGNRIEFYTSENLRDWNKTGEFGDGLLDERCIYECPDLFPLTAPGGQTVWVLLASVGAPAERGGGRVRYFLGEYDGASFRETIAPQTVRWLDDGFDNYAAVTFNSVLPGADRILIGWAANPAYADTTPADRFRGGMTLPRRLSLIETSSGMRLSQNPVLPEPIAHVSSVDGSLPNGAFALIIHADKPFDVRIENINGDELLLGVDNENNIYIDRTNSGVTDFDVWFNKPVYKRATYMREQNGECVIHLIIDGDLLECFADGGAFACAMRVFPTAPYSMLSNTTDVRVEICSW
jgi:sucrose-6-phosphate hydrolase SacC (GH32 family)